MKIHIVMEHNWNDGMVLVTPYVSRHTAIEHYRGTRQLWSGHCISEEVEDTFFLVRGRMECRIYEEELHG